MVSQQVLAKQATELLNLYTKLYTERTGNKPLLNIAKEKWAARDLITSFGIDECKRGTQWYFKVSKRHDWKTLVYNMDQFISESKSVEEDQLKRQKFRVIAKEWRES